MMKPVLRIDGIKASPVNGTIVLDWRKIAWRGSLILSVIGLVPFYTTISSVIIGLILSYITLLIGHSVGMHRMMIHRTFQCPKPLERFLIFIGVLVGMGGPVSIIKTHDIRDWAQRQPDCHIFSRTMRLISVI